VGLRGVDAGTAAGNTGDIISRTGVTALSVTEECIRALACAFALGFGVGVYSGVMSPRTRRGVGDGSYTTGVDIMWPENLSLAGWAGGGDMKDAGSFPCLNRAPKVCSELVTGGGDVGMLQQLKKLSSSLP
jgi:hypothetical protein